MVAASLTSRDLFCLKYTTAPRGSKRIRLPPEVRLVATLRRAFGNRSLRGRARDAWRRTEVDFPAEITRRLSRQPSGATICSGCAEQARSCTKTKKTYRAKD